MAGEEWLEKNLLVVAGVAVGIAFLQVCYYTNYSLCYILEHEKYLHFFHFKNIKIMFMFQILGICFAQNLRADIFAQMAKWN